MSGLKFIEILNPDILFIEQRSHRVEKNGKWFGFMIRTPILGTNGQYAKYRFEGLRDVRIVRDDASFENIKRVVEEIDKEISGDESD